MSGRLFVDRLVDSFKSAGVPRPKGARMAAHSNEADQSKLAELIEAHDRLWRSFDCQTDGTRALLARDIAVRAGKRFGLGENAELTKTLSQTALALISAEPGYFPFSFAGDLSGLSLLRIAELSNDVSHRVKFLTDKHVRDASVGAIDALLTHLLENMPSATTAPDDTSTISLTTDLASLIAAPHQFMTDVLANFLSNDAVQHNGLFAPVCRQLYRNVLEASGVVIDPDQPLLAHDIDKPTLPHDCVKEPPLDVVSKFFSHTPFEALFKTPAPFTLPTRARFEHCMVLGGIGHGKTQALQYMLFHDLIHATIDERISLVVIDSHGDLIKTLISCALFNPETEGSLAERFLLIDPTDIERPPALNLFNPGLERLDTYTPAQRELAFNSLVDIYGRFFGALLGADLTAKMSTLFRFLARLMLTIEGATIHTLIALMDEPHAFAPYIEKLDPTARRFFKKEFAKPGFNATRQQIKQRLYAVLSIPTFDRLFSAPTSKINFFDALNSGKIILIDTAKALLKEEGSAIFGRFMLALVEHAVTERTNIDADERTPVFCYMDEAHEYFDDTLENLIIEARKFNCGLTLAHQNLAQLTSPKLRAIFTGNTTVKLIGGVTDADARALAADMRTSSDFILSVKKRERDGVTEFALSVRNVTPQALKIKIPLGHFEAHPTLTERQRDILLETNRQRVGYDPEAQAQTDSPPPTPIADEPETPRAPTQRQAPAKPVPDVRPSEPHTETDTTHQAVQHCIKQTAQHLGFSAVVEQGVLDGAGNVDVSLEREGLRIACEVSVTTKPDDELRNIEKCLAAGYDHVWLTSPDAAHLETLRSALANAMPEAMQGRVQFFSPDDITNELTRLAAQSPPSRSTVLGYEVVVTHGAVDTVQATERRKRLGAVLKRLRRQARDKR